MIRACIMLRIRIRVAVPTLNQDTKLKTFFETHVYRLFSFTPLLLDILDACIMLYHDGALG